MKDEFLFCPLGGSGEIGMNMNLFGYGQPGDHKWIMVDIGVTFADDTIPGIDLIYPDPGFIYQRKENLLGIILALAIFFVFLRMLKKFKPNDAEVQVLDEDDQQMLAGTRSLGSGLTPELLNDLIQEKPDNVSTALRKYLETGSST